jgi:hypothetical protein
MGTGPRGDHARERATATSGVRMNVRSRDLGSFVREAREGRRRARRSRRLRGCLGRRSSRTRSARCAPRGW